MTRYNSRPRKGRSPLQKAQVRIRTPLGQFVKLSSTNPGFSTEPDAGESASYLDNPEILAETDSMYTITKKPLKNALAQEKRAKSTIQLLQERTHTLCDQFSEAYEARNATYEKLLSMKVKDLDLQIDKLREGGDKHIRAKSMVPNKLAKIKEILAALERQRVIGISSKLEEEDITNAADVGKDKVPESEEDGWPGDADMYFDNEVVS